jgi:hypothetical protein
MARSKPVADSAAAKRNPTVFTATVPTVVGGHAELLAASAPVMGEVRAGVVAPVGIMSAMSKAVLPVMSRLRSHRQGYAVPGGAASIEAAISREAMVSCKTVMTTMLATVRKMAAVPSAEMISVPGTSVPGVRIPVVTAMSDGVLATTSVVAFLVAGMPGVRAATVMSRGLFTVLAMLRLLGMFPFRVASLVRSFLSVAVRPLGLGLLVLTFVRLVGGEHRGVAFARRFFATEARIVLATTASPALSAATTAATFQSAFKLSADEFLPLGPLLVGQHTSQFFLGRLTRGLHLAECLGAVAIGVLED